jgi:hypothetical protein
MKELFTDLETVLSPRLKWIAESGILTHHTEGFGETAWMALLPWDKDKGKDIMTIFAESCRLYDEAGQCQYGPTEDDAIVELAKRLQLPLWNEGGRA